MIESLDNGKAAEPKYIQVANIIRQNILDGRWHEGDDIPPEKNTLFTVQYCTRHDAAGSTTT